MLITISIAYAGNGILAGVSKSKVLPKRSLQKALRQLSDWKTISSETKLRAHFTYSDYVSGLVLIARIAVHAELQCHHPDILYTYNKLTITLSTHEAGGITSKDIKLATTISELCNN